MATDVRSCDSDFHWAENSQKIFAKCEGNELKRNTDVCLGCRYNMDSFDLDEF